MTVEEIKELAKKVLFKRRNQFECDPFTEMDDGDKESILNCMYEFSKQQNTESTQQLKEAREIIKSSKRDKALLIDFVDVTISYKKELKAGILQIDQWLENNQEKHKPQCRICGATHGVNMGLCVDCTLAVMPTP